MTKSNPLKPYWIKPGISKIWMIQDIDDPWNDEINWAFDPVDFKRRHPGACFFSNMEKDKFWVKAWLYNFKVRRQFQKSIDRDVFAFWLNPNVLDELPV